jgi:major membrane immunogen (membrane-anchored lipoprotein)
MKLFRHLAICLAALLLTTCGSTHYKITLKDGREFMTASKPEFNEKTGYYKFRGLNEKDALIRADEILMMNEL